MARDPLTCPGCSATMAEVADAQATLEVCGSCRGIWLDRGELAAARAELPSDLVAVGASERQCPRCELPLTLCNSSVVEIDRCDGCGGTFLDGGELELLLDVHRPHRELPQRAQQPPRFRCDFCHELHVMTDQVIGENATACTACAERLGVRHDPKARRARELRRREASAGDGVGIDAGPEGSRYTTLFDDDLGGGLVGMLIDLFR